jgi:hypothetical protein
VSQPEQPVTIHQAFGLSWREFVIAVEAMEQAGVLQVRDDRTYRAWDVYRIWDLLARRTRTTIESDPATEIVMGWTKGSIWLERLDNAWWSAAEGMRQGRRSGLNVARAREMLDLAGAEPREETMEEHRARVQRFYTELGTDAETIAAEMPAEWEFWVERLKAHAGVVLDLRSAGFVALARLGSVQLSECIRLAEQRLGTDRNTLRARVGAVPRSMNQSALTAASSSPDVIARDLAFDFLNEELAAYNAGVPADLQMTVAEIDPFLTFLDRAGLKEWYSNLVLAGWEQDFFEMGRDLRVARLYGRLRTLAALVEEGLFAMAEHTGKLQFAVEVEAQMTFKPRLSRYIQGPLGTDTTVDNGALTNLYRNFTVAPPVSMAELQRCFTGLGLTNDQPVSVEQLLAGLLFIRNITSHRFPLVGADGRQEWFPAWDEQLPAVNRTLLWSTLILWKLARRFT